MKLTVTKSALSAALTSVSAVGKGRNSLPILSFSKLETTNPSEAVMTATDLDARYERVVPVNVVKEGSCLLHIAKVKEWIGIIPSGDVLIESDDNGIKMSTEESGSMKFAAMPVDQFPPASSSELKPIAVADFAPLKHIAWSVMEENNARPMLEAVFIEQEGEGMVAASTDGRKVGTVKIKAFLAAPEFPPLALPSAYISLVASLGECELLESDNTLHFSSKMFALKIRKTDYGIPPWRNAIVQHPYIGTCAVIREELASAIQQCHVLRGGELGSENGVAVRIERAENGMKISCMVAKTGASYSNTIAGKITGEFPVITLSTEHLQPFFALPDDSLLKVDFTGSKTFVHLNAGDVDYWFATLFPKEMTQ
jgi:DNA polymerase III sliding clamp (beta) subunit (PCNA family)